MWTNPCGVIIIQKKKGGKKGPAKGYKKTRATSVICVVNRSAIMANFMEYVSFKMETANPDCQMVANVITKDPMQSEELSPHSLQLCPQSKLSEPVRGDTPLYSHNAPATLPSLSTACLPVSFQLPTENLTCLL